jgi:hypothetical protein
MSRGDDVELRSFDASRVDDLAEVLDALPSLISYVDRDGILRYSNAAGAHWLRRPVEKMIDLPVRELLGEEGYRAVSGHIAAAQAGHRQEFIRVLPTADDTVTYALTQYLPRLRDGVPDGFYALSTDVTARVRADRALAEQDIRSAELEHQARRAVALSDDVLQQLYAVGLHLDRMARHPDRLSDSVEPVLMSLQDTITRIRAAITGALVGGAARTEDVVRQLVAGWSVRTATEPAVLVDDRVDQLSREDARRLLTALSEIMGTAARHDVGPFRVEVVVGSDDVLVAVEGQDWPEVARSEFSHMSYVEREDGGRLEVDAVHPVVTRVSWTRSDRVRGAE